MWKYRKFLTPSPLNFIAWLLAVMVFSSPMLGQSSELSIDLSWMEAHVGKSAGDILTDPHFPIDVAWYVPQVLVRLNGGLGLTPVAAAQFAMSRSLYVKNDNGLIAAWGCYVHSCRGAAGFILANTSALHPSLTLAFAGQQKDRGAHTAAHQMNLYIYPSFSQAGKPLDEHRIVCDARLVNKLLHRSYRPDLHRRDGPISVCCYSKGASNN